MQVHMCACIYGSVLSLTQATQQDNANRVGAASAVITIKTLHARSPVVAKVVVDVPVMENVPVGTIVMTSKARARNPV